MAGWLVAGPRVIVVVVGAPVIGGLFGIGLVSDANGPGPTAPTVITDRAGPPGLLRAPARHAIPDGADCLAHLPSPGAVPAPEPTSRLRAADNSSDIVTLHPLP